MKTNSQHIFYDFNLSEKLNEEHIQKIKNIIKKNFTVVKETSHEFNPHGETIVFILAESHFTLHTYPEHNYLSLDIYICNEDVDLFKTLDEIKNELPIQLDNTEYLTRGQTNDYKKDYNKNIIYLLTLITACCSIIYEFLMAETLSSIMGNTILRYNITIGLFVASMGLGSIYYNKIFKTQNQISQFIKLEFILSLIGFMSPILCLIFDYINRNLFNHNYQLSYFFNHSLIVLIGFIAGMEIPLLIDILKKVNKKSLGKILFFDYFGCVVGSIIFPFFFLEYFNIFQIGCIIAIINMLTALFGILYFKTKDYFKLFLGLLFCILIIVLFLNNFDQGLIKAFYVK